MKIIGAMAAMLLVGSASSVCAENANSIGYGSVADAMAALRADPAAQIDVQQGWTIVSQEKDGHLVLWSFTPKGHPAHPAAVKRTTYEKDGVVYIDMDALCQSDKTSCDELIEQFRRLNEQIRRSLESRQ